MGWRTNLGPDAYDVNGNALEYKTMTHRTCEWFLNRIAERKAGFNSCVSYHGLITNFRTTFVVHGKVQAKLAKLVDTLRTQLLAKNPL